MRSKMRRLQRSSREKPFRTFSKNVRNERNDVESRAHFQSALSIHTCRPHFRSCYRSRWDDFRFLQGKNGGSCTLTSIPGLTQSLFRVLPSLLKVKMVACNWWNIHRLRILFEEDASWEPDTSDEVRNLPKIRHELFKGHTLQVHTTRPCLQRRSEQRRKSAGISR